MALSVETYEQLQNRIKNLEAKLFLMREFKNAEEYNHLHQRTYTQQEAGPILDISDCLRPFPLQHPSHQ